MVSQYVWQRRKLSLKIFIIVTVVACIALYTHMNHDSWAADQLMQACQVDRSSKMAYQQYIICATQPFRPRAPTFRGYKGPWVENKFFEHFTQNVSKFTPSPVLYLPIHWTASAEHRLTASVNKFLSKLDSSHTYFTVFQLGRGVGRRSPYKYVYLLNIFKSSNYKFYIPHKLRIVGFYSGGCSACDKFLQLIPLPLLKKQLGPCPHTLPKRYNVAFQGSLKTDSVRGVLKTVYGKHFKFLNRDGDWDKNMCMSNFTLCPRGWGETSYRLYEAIQLGSIPIYVWRDEKVLPFTEFLNWEEFAIIAHIDDVERGMLLKHVSSAPLLSMQQRLLHVKQFFTYEFVLHYITSIVTEEPNTPYVRLTLNP